MSGHHDDPFGWPSDPVPMTPEEAEAHAQEQRADALNAWHDLMVEREAAIEAGDPGW